MDGYDGVRLAGRATPSALMVALRIGGTCLRIEDPPGTLYLTKCLQSARGVQLWASGGDLPPDWAWVSSLEIQRAAPYFHLPLDTDARKVLLRLPMLAAPTSGYEVLYHGTHWEAGGAILDSGELRPSRIGMMGPAVYLGDVHKAGRFAMLPADYAADPRYARGMVLRCIVTYKTLLAADKRRKHLCACHACRAPGRARGLRRCVDHDGVWRGTADLLYIPPMRWGSGRFTNRTPEWAAARSDQIVPLEGRELASRSRRRNRRGKHHWPGKRYEVELAERHEVSCRKN